MEDIDKEQLGDPYANAEYAKEIFEYMREREVGDACPGGDSPVQGRSDCSRAPGCPEALTTWQGAAQGEKGLV